MVRRFFLTVLALIVLTTPILAQKKGKKPPREGTVFYFNPDTPGYVTCDLEFRDRSDERWPNFFYGKPNPAGTFTFDPSVPRGTFSLLCDQLVQKNGNQSRRVLGDLLVPGKPTVAKLSIRSLGKMDKETVSSEDGKGKKGNKVVEYAPAEGLLEVAGKQVGVKAKATFRFGYGKNSEEPETVYIELKFTVKGSELGLKTFPGEIDCRAGITGFVKLPQKEKK